MICRPLAGTALVVAATILGGCGGDGKLGKADDAMSGLDAGRVRLELSATAAAKPTTAPVGFRMEGPFSTKEGSLAVLDLRYTRLLGGRESVTRVISTGEKVFVESEGKTVEVPDDKTGALRLGDGDGGISDLGISGWVRDAKVDERGDGTTKVTGEVDVADFLSDLGRISEQVAGGEANSRDLDSEAKKRLDRLVRSSELTVELAKDDLPRSVRAVVDFGTDIPEDLQKALGPFASARLVFTMSLERLNEPLVVERPQG